MSANEPGVSGFSEINRSVSAVPAIAVPLVWNLSSSGCVGVCCPFIACHAEIFGVNESDILCCRLGDAAPETSTK
jgi:hypothetical protein